MFSLGVLLLKLITELKLTQGSVTLGEWTEECRKNGDAEVSAQMLDPKLKGEADLEKLRVLVDIVNSALAENCEDRPNMSTIVDRIMTCMDLEPPSHSELPV